MRTLYEKSIREAVNKVDKEELSINLVSVMREYKRLFGLETLLNLTPSEFHDVITSHFYHWRGNSDALRDLKAVKWPPVKTTDIHDEVTSQLTTLPDSIGKLTNLMVLNLSSNQLTTLPDSIGKLTNLTTLNLSSNQLTTLPDSIGELTNLTRLDLSSNQLTTLPESISNLTNLTELLVLDNKLTILTKDWLRQLPIPTVLI